MKAALGLSLVSALGFVVAGAGCEGAPSEPTVERAGAIDDSDVASSSNVSNASQDLNVDFAACHEFAGIGFVPVANARRLVPARYTLAGDATTASAPRRTTT